MAFARPYSCGLRLRQLPPSHRAGRGRWPWSFFGVRPSLCARNTSGLRKGKHQQPWLAALFGGAKLFGEGAALLKRSSLRRRDQVKSVARHGRRSFSKPDCGSWRQRGRKRGCAHAGAVRMIEPDERFSGLDQNPSLGVGSPLLSASPSSLASGELMSSFALKFARDVQFIHPPRIRRGSGVTTQLLARLRPDTAKLVTPTGIEPVFQP